MFHQIRWPLPPVHLSAPEGELTPTVGRAGATIRIGPFMTVPPWTPQMYACAPGRFGTTNVYTRGVEGELNVPLSFSPSAAHTSSALKSMHHVCGPLSAENRFNVRTSPMLTVSWGPGLVIVVGVRPQPWLALPYRAYVAAPTGAGRKAGIADRRNAIPTAALTE